MHNSKKMMCSHSTQLAKHCLENYGDPHQDAAYLFPTLNIAKSCSDFLSLRNTSCRIHKVSLLDSSGSTRDAADPLTPTVFFAVLLPMEAASLGKQFWQHTGDGISSRFAERCLALIHKANTEPQWPPPRSTANARASSSRGLSRNKHYNKGNSDVLESIIRPTPPASSTSNGPSLALDEDEEVEAMPRAYVEERYGRNLGSIHGPLAKAALKRRIAGVLREQSSPITQQNLPNLSKLSLKEEESALNKAGGRATAHATSTRGVLNLAAEDVYLYPGGMSAIFHAHQILLERARREGRTAGKSICFGSVFPFAASR